MAHICNNRPIFHFVHVLTRNDISIASTRDENVRRRSNIFYRLYSMTVHTLKYCYHTGIHTVWIIWYKLSYHAWRAQIGSISVTETTDPIPKNVYKIINLEVPFDTFEGSSTAFSNFTITTYDHMFASEHYVRSSF